MSVAVIVCLDKRRFDGFPCKVSVGATGFANDSRRVARGLVGQDILRYEGDRNGARGVTMRTRCTGHVQCAGRVLMTARWCSDHRVAG